MFGRVGRAVRRLTGGRPVQAYGVAHVYNPRSVAGVAAVGLGTAGIASGAATVQTSDGPVSAVGAAVGRTLAWGEEAQRRHVPLPGRVLAAVTDDRVLLWEWTAAGPGAKVADWPRGSFAAVPVHFSGETGVEVTLASGLKALLTTHRGPARRRSTAALKAIAAAGR